MTRRVSFDLDGVVMENPFESCVLPRVRGLIRASPRLSDLPLVEADLLIDAAIDAEWRARMSRGETVAAFDWDEIYAVVSRLFGGPLLPPVAGLVEECCRPECIRLLPGVFEGLELLHDSGFRTVALTNGYSHYQAPVLASLGINHLFDELIAPNAINFAKPDPRIFRSVPGLVAHVGDTLYADVLGARRAGICAVWLAGALPDELEPLSPVERLGHEGFDEFLARRLALDPHSEWFADTPAELLRCDAVAQDVAEAAEAVIELLGVPTSD